MTVLRQASSGLVYFSESEHPFQPVYWPRELTGDQSIEPEKVRALAGLPRMRAGTQDFEEFFKPFVTIEEWYEEDDRELAGRYQRLKDTLQQTLTDITVMKFGELHKEVFVVGRAEEGGIGGLRTKAVES